MRNFQILLSLGVLATLMMALAALSGWPLVVP